MDSLIANSLYGWFSSLTRRHVVKPKPTNENNGPTIDHQISQTTLEKNQLYNQYDTRVYSHSAGSERKETTYFFTSDTSDLLESSKMDKDMKNPSSNDDNSIEEDIEEVITEATSGTEQPKTKSESGKVVLQKRQLFDLDPGETSKDFSIDEEALSGGGLAKYFKPDEAEPVEQTEDETKKDETFSQRTENDVSEIDEGSQLYVRSLDFKSSILNVDPRDCMSLDSQVRVLQPRPSSRSDSNESYERDHSLEEMVASNHSIEITLDSKELSSLDPNINIDNESQINRLLADSQTSPLSEKQSQSRKETITENPEFSFGDKTHTIEKSPQSDKNRINATDKSETDESDMSDLKQKILSLPANNSTTKGASLPLLRDVSFEQTEDQSIAVKQMERVSNDFTKEALDDITEESEKVSLQQQQQQQQQQENAENDNTSNDFDSIISLNMIQMLENKVKDLQEIVTSKDVCLASLSMQLDSAQRRESYATSNENRDSLRDLPPSGRDSSSLATTTSTEYRTIHDDLAPKIFDFQSELIQRNQLIEKLTDSLQQSIHVREQLQSQSEKLATEVQQLRKQLTETLDQIKKPYWPRDQESSTTGQRLSEISIDLVSESDEDLERHFLTDNEEKMPLSNRNSKERQLGGDILSNAGGGGGLISSFDNFEPEPFGVSKQIEQFQKYLNPEEMRIFFMVQKKYDDFLSQEIEKVKMKCEGELKMTIEQMENEKCEKDLEINRLRQLLTSVKNGSTELDQLRKELETVHSMEMGKLRTYFEKKCADLEKHYSEEVFSQKSQRLSGDTSPSDMSDQEVIQDDTTPTATKPPLIVKKRSLEELFASPIHRQLTPTTLDCLEKESEASLEELKTFYKEKFREMSQKYEDNIKRLKVKLRRFESKYADDEFMALLSETTTDDNNWPPELILLREKFTAKSQLEIAQLQIKHEEEMSRLKIDYEKQLNRKNKRNSTFDLSRDLDAIVNERDNLRELSTTFLYLLQELAKCVSICEDDLNSTIVEQLQKHGFIANQSDHNVSGGGDNDQSAGVLNVSTQSNQELQEKLSKSLQFVPNVSNLLSLIEDPTLIDFIADNNQEGEFKLKDCVEKLRSEANTLLVLSEKLSRNREKQDGGATEKCDSCEEEDGLKANPNRPSKLDRANSFNEAILREGLQHSQAQLLSLPVDIGRMEICSTQPCGKEEIFESNISFSEEKVTLNELQNRLVKSESERLKLRDELQLTITKNKELLAELFGLRDQLKGLDSLQREDLSEGYGISEIQSPPRIRRERNPSTSFAQLQDKARNLLSTPTKNMSDNTATLLLLIEEFCREGDKVVETGKRDRDDLQAQFEQMEQQIHGLTQQVSEYESQKDKLEIELKASIDKIFVLREIITDLETQVDTKALNENVLNEKVKELEAYMSSQARSNETLQQEVESLKTEIGHGYQERIAQLEEQLRNTRSSSEQNLAIEHLAEQLRDIETTLDQKTKTLESLHATFSNSLSDHYSEDVSVQNLPRDSNPTPQASPINTPRHHSLPVDEIQRVFQKLSKHTRVEEAAIKKIKELELQVQNIRTGYTELENERKLLQEKMTEQVLRISSLQAKLDEQRRRAEELNRQGTSDFAARIHDLQGEVYNLKETLSARDKQITNLKNHLEQSKKIIDRQEAELAITIQGDSGRVDTLEAELKAKVEEIQQLKDKMKKEMINKLALPDLMETMLADKNEEIDNLREQLEKKEKDLQGILTINLGQGDNSAKDRGNDQGDGSKGSGRTLSDIVSISEYDEPDLIRRAITAVDTQLELPQSSFPEKTMDSSKCAIANLTEKRSGDNTMFDHPANSQAMRTFDQPNFFMGATNSAKFGNNTTVSFAPRQINFSEFVDESKIKESTPKIIEVTGGEGEEIETLRKRLKTTEDRAESLKMSLEAIESEKVAEINQLKAELEASTKMYEQLLKEKNNLEEKIKTSEELEQELIVKSNNLEKLSQQINESETKIKALEKQIAGRDLEIANLKSTIAKKTDSATDSNEKILDLNHQIELLTSQVKQKDEILSKYEKNLLNLQQNERLQSDRVAQVELEKGSLLTELDMVRAELAEKVLLYQKAILDVESFTAKYEKLQQDLATKERILQELQSQSGESEEVQSLVRKIEELDERNTFLESELERLRSQSGDSKPYSLDEIADKVEKELNYSAQLDTNILKAIESEEENNLNPHPKINTNKSNENNLLSQLDTFKAQLEAERKNTAQLQLQLNEVRAQTQDIQQQDADIIEAMRLRLEEAIEKETELHKILDEEREKCERLSNQLSVLQRTEARKSSAVSKTPPDTPRKIARAAEEAEAVERLKEEIKLVSAQNERERERVNDLQKVLEREKSRFEKELTERVEYGEKLKREMDKIKHEKDLADEEVEHLQERLTSTTREIESLETRISTLQEAETRRAYRRGKERTESTQNAIELQDLRNKIVQLESERDHLNEVIKLLREDVDRGAQREAKLAEALANSGNDNSIPEQFMQKLKEMNYLLSENAKENRQMAETLQFLTDERKMLQRKCGELEASCQTGAVVATSLSEMEERANHLFGKYLRVESHRKALVHQKRYLTIILQTYQENEAKALNLLNGGAPKRKKRRSFKCIALIVIAIERMKFIVRRWNTGKIVVSKSVFNLATQNRRGITTALAAGNATTTASRGGKHVLTSYSPPCRDRSQTERSNLVNMPLRPPLQAPSLISECTDKLDWTNRWK